MNIYGIYIYKIHSIAMITASLSPITTLTAGATVSNNITLELGTTEAAAASIVISKLLNYISIGLLISGHLVKLFS